MRDQEDRMVETWRSMLRGSMSVGRNIRELFHRYDITGPQFRVLSLLGEAGEDGMMLSDIGAGMHVTGGNITNLVDRLEERGYVARQPHPSDRRALLAVLTEAGSQVLDEIEPPYQARIHKILSCLSDGEQDTLRELLGRVRESAEQFARESKLDK